MRYFSLLFFLWVCLGAMIHAESDMPSQFIVDKNWHQLTGQQQNILIHIFKGEYGTALNLLQNSPSDYTVLTNKYDLLDIMFCEGSYDAHDLKIALLEYLLSKGIKINAGFIYKITNLQYVMSVCLNHGLNPNFQLSDGDTWLMYAIKNCSVNAVSILLKYGADPKIKNNVGKDAYDYCHEWFNQAYSEDNIYVLKNKLKMIQEVYGYVPKEMQNRVWWKEIKGECVAVASVVLPLTILGIGAYLLTKFMSPSEQKQGVLLSQEHTGLNFKNTVWTYHELDKKTFDDSSKLEKILNNVFLNNVLTN